MAGLAATAATDDEPLGAKSSARRSTLPLWPAEEFLKGRQLLEIRNHLPPDESTFHGLESMDLECLGLGDPDAKPEAEPSYSSSY
jgi:hypothetical protein